MNDEPENPSSVTVKRLRVFFLLLGTGIILAVLILILKLTVHRRKHNILTVQRIKQNKRNDMGELVWKKQHPTVCPFAM
jgi:hypothetical protein